MNNNKDTTASLDALIAELRECYFEHTEGSSERHLIRALDALEAMRAQRDDVVHDSFYETGYGLTSGAANKIGTLDAEIARVLLHGRKP